MTKPRLLELLEAIRQEMGVGNSDEFYRHLETLTDEDVRRWGEAIEKERGVESKDFISSLNRYLLLREKPWAE